MSEEITLNKTLKHIVFSTALILSAFQLFTGGFGVLTPMLQRGFHITLVLVLVFLLYPISKSGKWRWLDYLAACLALGNGIYIYFSYLDFVDRVGAPNLWDKFFAAVTIILLLEGTRRMMGWILPGIAAFFLLYSYAGNLFPGVFKIGNFSYDRIISLQYMSTSGIWGLTTGVAATYVALFIIFGAFLQSSGAGKIFMDLAFSIGGRYRGGPAKVAVISSGLTGTVSGSAVANVSTTGVFTIPLMKRVGYTPQTAGAIEAVASTGGQIMPPVMGAGAFIMANITGIPYGDIVVAAFIPALLYYVSVFCFVDLEAGRLGIKGLARKDLPDFKSTFLQGTNLYIGLGCLIYLLVFVEVSPMKAAFWSVVTLVASTIVLKFKTVKWTFIIEGLEEGAKAMLLVSMACTTAGIIVGTINLTGIGVTLTTLMMDLGRDSLFLVLIITTICCIIMGMGLPPAASYILLAVLTAPSLVLLGMPVLLAHMFVFYYISLAPITPPVALAAYTGAGLAGSDPTKTSFTSVRIGLVGFVVPFIFVYYPSLLAQGEWKTIIGAFISASVGILFLNAFVVGWFKRKLNMLERAFTLPAALLMIIPGWFTDMLGITFIIIFILYLHFVKEKTSLNETASS